jgi:hypothetical protein
MILDVFRLHLVLAPTVYATLLHLPRSAELGLVQAMPASLTLGCEAVYDKHRKIVNTFGS